MKIKSVADASLILVLVLVFGFFWRNPRCDHRIKLFSRSPSPCTNTFGDLKTFFITFDTLENFFGDKVVCHNCMTFF